MERSIYQHLSLIRVNDVFLSTLGFLVIIFGYDPYFGRYRKGMHDHLPCPRNFLLLARVY